MKKCPLCEGPMFFTKTEGPPVDNRGMYIPPPLIPSGTNARCQFGKLTCIKCDFETPAYNVK